MLYDSTRRRRRRGRFGLIWGRPDPGVMVTASSAGTWPSTELHPSQTQVQSSCVCVGGAENREGRGSEDWASPTSAHQAMAKFRPSCPPRPQSDSQGDSEPAVKTTASHTHTLTIARPAQTPSIRWGAPRVDLQVQEGGLKLPAPEKGLSQN